MTYLFAFCIAAFAAVSDVKSRKISNRFLKISFLVGIADRSVSIIFSGNHESTLPDALVGMFIPLFLLLIPYAIGCFGASDIKLLSVIGILVGGKTVFEIVMLSIVITSISSVPYVALCFVKGNMGGNIKHTVPFAVPIFTAVCLCIVNKFI